MKPNTITELDIQAIADVTQYDAKQWHFDKEGQSYSIVINTDSAQAVKSVLQNCAKECFTKDLTAEITKISCSPAPSDSRLERKATLSIPLRIVEDEKFKNYLTEKKEEIQQNIISEACDIAPRV